MSYFLCDDCSIYVRSWEEVERHEDETGHTFVDDSPDWTI